jgi:hypothetical protein
MAVRCAIRVELALRARDIPRAVYGTVAFFEAAFWDWLREYDFGAEGITRISDTAYQLPASPSADQTQRFRPNTNGTRRINDFDRGIRAWLPVLNRPHLEAFWDALADDVRNLRHDVAHNEPTSDLMNDARNRMAQAGLWSAEGQFLTQALTTNVLMELGSAEPANICENLLTLVRSRLVDEPDYVA